jgi:hypothetical protein
MAWERPALCEAVSCRKVDPDRLPGRIYDMWADDCRASTRRVNHGQ